MEHDFGDADAEIEKAASYRAHEWFPRSVRSWKKRLLPSKWTRNMIASTISFIFRNPIRTTLRETGVSSVIMGPICILESPEYHGTKVPRDFRGNMAPRELGENIWFQGISGETWFRGISGKTWFRGISGETWFRGISEEASVTEASNIFVCTKPPDT